MGVDFVVAYCPGTSEETFSDTVVGPADTTIRTTLFRTLTAGSLAYVLTEAAGRTGQAGEGVGATGPIDRMSCFNLKGGAITTLSERGGSAIDGYQQRIDVFTHIAAAGVEGLRVRGRGYNHGLFLAAVARSSVEHSEPRLSITAVPNEMDIDVETAQVILGMGEVMGGDMCNDETTNIDRLSNTVRDLKEAENKTSGDGRGEHCW